MCCYHCTVVIVRNASVFNRGSDEHVLGHVTIILVFSYSSQGVSSVLMFFFAEYDILVASLILAVPPAGMVSRTGVPRPFRLTCGHACVRACIVRCCISMCLMLSAVRNSHKHPPRGSTTQQPVKRKMVSTTCIVLSFFVFGRITPRPDTTPTISFLVFNFY